MSSNSDKDRFSGTDESKVSLSDEVDNGKNKHLVKCLFCPSRILHPGTGIYRETVVDLPLMAKKKDSADNHDSEKLNHFWTVNDMYTFENVGFSNTVGNVKYLACADCEVGPIGYYDIIDKISYVALARVCHVEN